MLLEYHAYVTSRDENNSAPLHLVSIKGKLDVVKITYSA